MARSLLSDAFGHHVWATLRLLDACAELSQKELSTPAPGTYGSIIDTFRHLVGADAGYLFSLTEGRVAIDPGVVLERSTVRGPAIIGRGSRITDAYIGPYTAVGEDVTIQRAELEHSIVLEGSSIRDLEGRIEASLIGKEVRIQRSQRKPSAYRFMVGDSSLVDVL